jgi:hypothetical protein
MSRTFSSKANRHFFLWRWHAAGSLRLSLLSGTGRANRRNKNDACASLLSHNIQSTLAREIAPIHARAIATFSVNLLPAGRISALVRATDRAPHRHPGTATSVL